ncbi:hypothetical protein MAA_11106 [Metarhizium robertsii ARSEF 23]|nr:uncharacterized protein MAA_11106 [Metarhizium robertsii ARSEF 23]KHO11291.1 hypothetical protein MAA_11106 [Metarhizium robertsii ARSEF 23]
MVLHNYVYRRWFRPYQSEIDHMRFICKPIEPRDLPEESVPSRSTITTLISLNKAICDKTERRRHVYRLIRHRARRDGVDYKNHILQPLFRALLVIICSKGYNKEDSKHIGPLPVVLVSTGIEDGLSAPIKFDSIKDKILGYVEGMNRKAVETTLEVAVDFVMGLEAREVEVFGLQPDPVLVWRAHPSVIEMWEKLEGDQPLFGPSSWYMDVKKWTSWQGTGEQNDRWIMDQYEKWAFRNHDRWEARKAARLEESKGL